MPTAQPLERADHREEIPREYQIFTDMARFRPWAPYDFPKPLLHLLFPTQFATLKNLESFAFVGADDSMISQSTPINAAQRGGRCMTGVKRLRSQGPAHHSFRNLFSSRGGSRGRHAGHLVCHLAKSIRFDCQTARRLRIEQGAAPRSRGLNARALPLARPPFSMRGCREGRMPAGTRGPRA